MGEQVHEQIGSGPTRFDLIVIPLLAAILALLIFGVITPEMLWGLLGVINK